MSAEIQFEKALEKLEKIVQDLEEGNVSLDDSLKKYEDGVKLVRACQEKLTQAEKKIEVLTKAGDGSLKRKKFKPDSEHSGEEQSSSRASLRKKTQAEAGDDEDLLI